LFQVPFLLFWSLEARESESKKDEREREREREKKRTKRRRRSRRGERRGEEGRGGEREQFSNPINKCKETSYDQIHL
jgi:hypothetical protein